MKRLVCWIAALALLGCPDAAKTEATKTDGKTGAAPSPKRVTFGEESPQAVYAKLKTAMDADVTDLQAMADTFQLVSRTSRVEMLGSMYQAAAFATMTKGKEDPKKIEEVRGICIRHGASPDAGDIKARLTSRERLRAVFGPVPDAVELMRDLAAFAQKHGKREPKRTRPRFVSDLTEVEVKEKRATGKAKVSVLGKERVQTLKFVQEDGRWVWETPK